MNATASLYHDRRHKKKDNTYPVRLRVTFNRKSRYYPTKYSLTAHDFDHSFGKARPRGEMKDLKLRLSAIEAKAFDIIYKLDYFSFEQFERRFVAKVSDFEELSFHLYDRSAKLRKEGRISSADLYKLTGDKIKAWTKGKGIHIREITPERLRAFEGWLLSNRISLTTVGIYMRYVRATYNAVNEELQIPPQQYPFGQNKYIIPNPRNIKKALTAAQVLQLINTTPEKPEQIKAKDFFLLSLYAQGMNLHDLLHAKHSQLEGDKLTFHRSKTHRRKAQGSLRIQVYLVKQAMDIINKYKSEDSEYIFPILNIKMTHEERKRKVKTFTRFVNQHLKALVKKEKIVDHISAVYARHTWATLAKRGSGSVEMIAEAMGHANIKTTQVYLDSFEDETRRDFNEKIFDL